MYLIADAMKRAGVTSGPQLRDAIAATKDFAGVTGQTTIDEHRNSAKTAVMLAVRHGRSEFFQTVTP
jgi:branched-chain amino acid transport system substrate-binding protein